MLNPAPLRRSPLTATRKARSRPRPGHHSAQVLATLSSEDCMLLALLLIERLSLAETAEALDLTVHQVRHDYEAAISRVRRAIASSRVRKQLTPVGEGRVRLRKAS